MENLEKYNSVFAEVFSVTEDKLNELFDNQHVEGWDSVRQLSLTTALEDAFDIMLDAEDIMGFTSYQEGKSILSKYDILI
jgi:acyl carrier protein